VSVASTDHRAQEDARRLRWSGTGPGRVWLHTATPIDLSGEDFSDASLVATIRLGSTAQGPVPLSMGCGSGCSGAVALDPLLAAVPAGEWTRIGVPLRCFAQSGADLSRVSEIFHIDSAARLDLSVSSIGIGPAPEHSLRCPGH